jgi:hypothetical protein
MRTTLVAAISIAAIATGLAPTPARAADACKKECSAFYKACVQNHSNEACKVDYDICMKHCRK